MPLHFQVYPGQPSPLTVAKAPSPGVPTSSLPQLTTQYAALYTPYQVAYEQVMFINVAMTGATAAPTFQLQAGGGPALTLTGNHTQINSAPTTRLGDAWVTPASANVFNIFVGFDSTPTVTWYLTIQNNDTTAGGQFTWVVADNPTDAVQPWIDVEPVTLSFDALINEVESDSVQVTNYGTGPSTVTALSPALPANLALGTTLPVTLQPGTTASLAVNFNAPGTSGPTNATATLTINPADSQAGTAGHNQQLTINAVAQQLEVVLLLDYSGSMTWDPLGNPLPAGSPSARLSELVDAANDFLNDLAHFGNNRGTYGVARFPEDPSAQPPQAPFDIRTPAAIPAKLSQPLIDVQNAIRHSSPLDSTPMGDGMHHVMDTATSYFLTDQNSIDNNLRLLILMTDGAQNQGSSPTDFITSPPDLLVQNKIALFAVGYGIPMHTNVDLDLLTKLASNSYGGGGFRAVDRDGITAMTLAGALADAIKADLTPVASSRDPSAVFLFGQDEARQDVLLTPYDGKTAFSLNWNTPDVSRLRLELLSPACEVITPDNAGQGALSQVTFIGGTRSQSYYFDADFLANPGGQPRYGTWTMVVTRPIEIQAASPGAAAVSQVYENYSYGVTTESSLRMRLTLDQNAYYAGDPVGVSARLTAAGLPVTGASVVLSTTSPAQSLANWLAGITVPAAAMAQAAKQLQGQDATPILVKALAAQIAGLQFNPAAQQGTLVMTDPRRIGTYQATYTDTAVPEQRTLYVTAIGETPDGTSFRREGKVGVFVQVRPDPVATILTLHFGSGGTANATVFPRDKFGNVLFTEPRPVGSLQLVASGAEFTGPMVNNLDGSYSRPLRITGPSPAVGVQFDGQDVIPARPVPPLAGLHYVDQVIRFRGGAIASANQHSDPQAVLGTVDGKPADTFVSLGAGGQLTVGFRQQVILAADGGDDITVFIEPDDDLRAYRLEASSTEHRHEDDDNGDDDNGHGDHRRWVPLGESIGVTQSFSLSAAGLEYTGALRITDTSGRARGADLNPLTTPGVSVRGVGVLKTGRERSLPLKDVPDWLSRPWHELT